MRALERHKTTLAHADVRTGDCARPECALRGSIRPGFATYRLSRSYHPQASTQARLLEALPLPPARLTTPSFLHTSTQHMHAWMYACLPCMLHNKSIRNLSNDVVSTMYPRSTRNPPRKLRLKAYIVYSYTDRQQVSLCRLRGSGSVDVKSREPPHFERQQHPCVRRLQLIVHVVLRLQCCCESCSAQCSADGTLSDRRMGGELQVQTRQQYVHQNDKLIPGALFSSDTIANRA
jgi:hypothetical protein